MTGRSAAKDSFFKTFRLLRGVAANPALPPVYHAACRVDAVLVGITSGDAPSASPDCATQAATWCTESARLSPQHPLNTSESGHQGVANSLWEQELT